MTIKEVQQVCLDILKDVHEFCVENNIRYSLSGGTLLGAIRHNGFIPWDDDIDIQLPRPDFDKFIHSYKSKKGYKLFSHEIEGNEETAFPYARICEMENTVVDTGFIYWCSVQTGIWIDVLPCDGMPSDKEEAHNHFKRLIHLEKRAWLYGFKNASISIIHKKNISKDWLFFLAKKIITFFWHKDSFKQFIDERKKYSYELSEFFICTSHYGMKEYQPKRNMEDFQLHRFEDAEFFIMSGYHNNLHNLYGDYMQIPPENKRKIGRAHV